MTFLQLTNMINLVWGKQPLKDPKAHFCTAQTKYSGIFFIEGAQVENKIKYILCQNFFNLDNLYIWQPNFDPNSIF
jgi:hypothetical protein